MTSLHNEMWSLLKETWISLLTHSTEWKGYRRNTYLKWRSFVKGCGVILKTGGTTDRGPSWKLKDMWSCEKKLTQTEFQSDSERDTCTVHTRAAWTAAACGINYKRNKWLSHNKTTTGRAHLPSINIYLFSIYLEYIFILSMSAV